MASIEIDQLSKYFPGRNGDGGLTVLDGVSLTVDDQQFLCLLGRSGCGKSTLLNVISGLDREYQGRVSINGRVLGYGGRVPVRLGYVFQEPRLLPWQTVRKNIDFALKYSSVPKAARARQTDEWIERVGLLGFGGAYPHELSGGMQGRASIARAFAVDPDVLLMDEPFSGLDEFTGRSLRGILLELWRETRKTVVFVTHNCFEACYLADRIMVFSGRPGRIAEGFDVDFPRPRDYDSARLFELSVKVTHAVTNAASEPEEGMG